MYNIHVIATIMQFYYIFYFNLIFFIFFSKEMVTSSVCDALVLIRVIRRGVDALQSTKVSIMSDKFSI